GGTGGRWRSGGLSGGGPGAVAGRAAPARGAKHAAVLGHYGLPTGLPAGVDDAALVNLMRQDKKVTVGLAFVLDGPDGAELVRGVPERAVTEALAAMPRAER
ncbi:3-dehydroquinate synthase, partial [Streptomyces olivaceus]